MKPTPEEKPAHFGTNAASSAASVAGNGCAAESAMDASIEVTGLDRVNNAMSRRCHH